MNLDITNRKDILQKSLFMETITSQFLALILGIKKPLESKSFGNTGSALSFSQRVNLLMDLGALNSELRSKYQLFMEIRNQFMHNADAGTYEECLNFIGK